MAALPNRFLRGSTAPGEFPVSFEDVAAKAGLTEPTIYGGVAHNTYILETTGCGAAFIDYDNDGWPDLFLVNGTRLDSVDSQQHSNRLLHNNRDGTFTDVTRQAGLTHFGWGQGVCVGDYDNDGYDDLFVTYWGQNILVSQQWRRHFHRCYRKMRLADERNALGCRVCIRGL